MRLALLANAAETSDWANLVLAKLQDLLTRSSSLFWTLLASSSSLNLLPTHTFVAIVSGWQECPQSEPIELAGSD